jgi:hypothetical protein
VGTLARLLDEGVLRVFTLIYKGEPAVIVNISEDGANAALDTLGNMMNGGSIELLTGDGGVLATLQLSDPAAQTATGGELEFNEIAEGEAALTGQAASARILASDGSEIFSCDVGAADSDAVIRLGTTQISAGTPVRLDSFTLAMP